jgi:hypothetical protein
MAKRVAGVAYLYIDGNQVPLRGNFTVSPSMVERTMLAGQDGVHGYQEIPRVPWAACDLTTMPDLNLEDIDGQVDVTVMCTLANGKNYSFANATCKAGLENNTRDGQVMVRWEAISCTEF